MAPPSLDAHYGSDPYGMSGAVGTRGLNAECLVEACEHQRFMLRRFCPGLVVDQRSIEAPQRPGPPRPGRRLRASVVKRITGIKVTRGAWIGVLVKACRHCPHSDVIDGGTSEQVQWVDGEISFTQ